MNYCSSEGGNCLIFITNTVRITNRNSYYLGSIRQQSHVEEFNIASAGFEEVIAECLVCDVDLSGLRLDCCLIIRGSCMNDTIPPVDKLVVDGFSSLQVGVRLYCLEYVKNFSKLANRVFQLGDIADLEFLSFVPDSRDITIISDTLDDMYMSRVPNISNICVKKVCVDQNFKGIGKMLACFSEIEKLVIPIEALPKLSKQTRVKTLKLVEDKWHNWDFREDKELDLSPLSYRDDITKLIVKHSGLVPIGKIHDNFTLVSFVDKGPMYQNLKNMLKRNKNIQDQKRTKYTKVAI